ncbi:hypothetical protein [Dyadobacter sp. CY356]|nr:hypothetical protein [Dyadobacter sp. CY356]
MRTIKNLTATDGYFLKCFFDDGITRNADITFFEIRGFSVVAGY